MRWKRENVWQRAISSLEGWINMAWSNHDITPVSLPVHWAEKGSTLMGYVERWGGICTCLRYNKDQYFAIV